LTFHTPDVNVTVQAGAGFAISFDNESVIRIPMWASRLLAGVVQGNQLIFQ
jgi:hypothetical protein